MDASSEDTEKPFYGIKNRKAPEGRGKGILKENKKLSPDRTDVLVSHVVGNTKEKEIFLF